MNRLERLGNFMPVILAAIFILICYAWVVTEREKDKIDEEWAICFGNWGAANSQRNLVLDYYATEAAFQRGVRDTAHRYLVDNYGAGSDPTNEGNQEAVRAFDMADDAVKIAEANLATARLQFTPPQLHKFCPRVPKPEKVPLPKVRGTKSPSPTPTPTQ